VPDVAFDVDIGADKDADAGADGGADGGDAEASEDEDTRAAASDKVDKLFATSFSEGKTTGKTTTFGVAGSRGADSTTTLPFQ
jgi:hypothetical protein